jgi:hypothetical protein
LEQFNLKRRVLIETTAEGILIRKPEGEAHSGEQGASSSEQVDAEEETVQIPSSWSTLWQSVKSRFVRREKK